MNRLSIALLSLGVLLQASAAFAHGPQMQITNTDGKIVTRDVFLDGPYGTLTDPKSVYVMPLLPSGDVYYSRPNPAEGAPGIALFNSGPGFAYGLGETFAAGSVFTLSFADALKFWNGASFVDPGTEQIEAFRGSINAPAASAVTSDVGPYASFSFNAIPTGYDDEAHSSASFRLLGDGVSNTASSDDGIYLLTLQLSTSQTDVEASDPYYFVLYKNVPLADAMVAARALGVDPSAIQVVPEAGSLTLSAFGAAVAGAALLRRLARRRPAGNER